MENNLSIIEELEIEEDIKTPHLSYITETLSERMRVSFSILKKNETEIVLIASSGFLIDSVFAGLTEKHIEYIAKNAPSDYKKNIMIILKDEEMMRGVFEIAKAMDEDKNTNQNQERIGNVIRYIKDNQIAFEF
ncbi:MAG: hypothetical protein A2288_01980 [Candidatus Moranbacteria bacterium RIFOXYA12_FULL_44_15]|nr:MAG: hypothetical protein A2288_01980 [Candidatus Moranbacteria bacterium RIFOXYA12_FULL_44_15]OGI35454.1 MAG: hypothetical protein A2259_02395 [Candidatus Moranbacteria bacterium RIFOXYA2_FULL_43_15]